MICSPDTLNYAKHTRFYPSEIKKQYKPKRIKVHVVTGHIIGKIIIRDSDLTTPGKNVYLAQSFLKKI
jgi:hypothetical protein